MVDFATFSNNVDSIRFEQTMQSTRTAGVKNLYLSNKGIPKRPFEDIDNVRFSYVSDGNNVNGKLYKTRGGAMPALSFIGTWASNSSQVLVYYELDGEDWIQNILENS